MTKYIINDIIHYLFSFLFSFLKKMDIRSLCFQPFQKNITAHIICQIHQCYLYSSSNKAYAPDSYSFHCIRHIRKYMFNTSPYFRFLL